jgi:hypothetical protein
MKLSSAAPLVGATLLAAGAAAAPVEIPAVPAALRAPAGQVPTLAASAVGVQVYDCRAAAGGDRYEWSLRAPEATLYDGGGRRIGIHYAGPTWEADDGSKVAGAAVARDDGPDAGAIPWLLLKATAASGRGLLDATSYVQRTRTVGGKAPADGCGPAQAGAVARVPYTATYTFYAAAR